MGIVKATTKKVYASDSIPSLRVLSSGIKISRKSMQDMGLNAGDKVHYAVDDEDGSIYLYATEEGNKVSTTNTFANVGLVSALVNSLGLTDFVAGRKSSLKFAIATEPTEGEFYLLSAGKHITGDAAESDVVEEEEAPVLEEAVEEEI
jgi:hypothetical protein